MNMEQVAVLLVLSIVMLPIIIIGVVLCCGKGEDLIAGYNTASPAEKAKWDAKALCRGTGVLVLLIAGCIEMILVGSVTNRTPLEWTGMGALPLVTVGGLVFLNKSERFKKQ